MDSFSRLNDHLGGSDRWAYPVLATFTIFAFLSSLGRADLNVPLSLFGLLFVHHFTRRHRRHFMAVLVLSYVLDLVWLIIHADVGKRSRAEHVSFERGVVIFAFVMSVLNLAVKAALCFILYFMTDFFLQRDSAEGSAQSDADKAPGRRSPREPIRSLPTNDGL
jgi:hypothetical protein